MLTVRKCEEMAILSKIWAERLSFAANDLSVVCWTSRCGKINRIAATSGIFEKQGCFVVYFAADDQDINPEDTEYTDILLACTRHLLEKLQMPTLNLYAIG